MEKKYFMGIDAGTSGFRISIFDKTGRCLGTKTAGYNTEFPKSGWAEQDDSEWLAAMKIAIPGAIEAAGIAPEEIAALACDGTTSTAVFLNREDRCVRKPILWMDVRAAAQAERIFRCDHNVTRFYPSGVPAESLIPKSMWVKENEPEVWAKVATVMEFTDWLNFQLTGVKCANKSAATVRGLYDDVNGGWQRDFLAEMGVEELADMLCQNVVPLAGVVGYVSAQAAEAFGLAEGTLVAEGGIDAITCMIGTGVVESGDMALIGGTSSVLLGLSPVEFHVDGVNGAYPNAVTEGTSLIEGGQASSGSILAWFKQNLIPQQWQDDAKAKGVSMYHYLDEQAGSVPIGSDGLVMVDYFQGNRVPYADSFARGIFWGLSLVHTTAHMARAILEGVAYGTAHCLRALADGGYKVSRIYACGGMAQSDLWMQIHADVTGVEICITSDTQNTGCLGDAMIAAVAAGTYKNLKEAADNMVRFDRVFSPNMENHETYAFFLDRYIETWPQMSEIVHKTVQHVSR